LGGVVADDPVTSYIWRYFKFSKYKSGLAQDSQNVYCVTKI